MYYALKAIHLCAVIIFLGNIITGFFWMAKAYDTRNSATIAFVSRVVIWSDRWLTIPSIIIITAGGVALAIHAGLPILRTGWIAYSILLFSLSGVCFALKGAPLQKKLHQMASEATQGKELKWEDFKVLYLEWEIWGVVSIALPITSLFLMIFKVPQ